MALDLKKLEYKLDEALDKETPESWLEWLLEERDSEIEAGREELQRTIEELRVALKGDLNTFGESIVLPYGIDIIKPTTIYLPETSSSFSFTIDSPSVKLRSEQEEENFSLAA